MVISPVITALIGATAGVAVCTYALRKYSDNASLDIDELRVSAGITMFFAGVLAFIKIGIGAVFAQPISGSLSIDTSKPVGALLIPAGWACASAGIEILIVLGWLMLHRQ